MVVTRCYLSSWINSCCSSRCWSGSPKTCCKPNRQCVRPMKRRLTKKTLPKTNTTHWDSKPPTWPPARLGAPKASARRFRPRPYDASKGIQLGALVCLVDSDDRQQQLFLGPDGGSMKLVSGAQLVQVISSEAPLGRAMLGKCEGDEVWIQVASIRQQFEVLRVY